MCVLACALTQANVRPFSTASISKYLLSRVPLGRCPYRHPRGFCTTLSRVPATAFTARSTTTGCLLPTRLTRRDFMEAAWSVRGRLLWGRLLVWAPRSPTMARRFKRPRRNWLLALVCRPGCCRRVLARSAGSDTCLRYTSLYDGYTHINSTTTTDLHSI
jgi:hypothetical protein